MSRRISEMDEAVSFGEDDLIPIVKNGANKKATGSKIKDFIGNFFVKKTGDTFPAGSVSFNNTGTDLTSNEVQALGVELNTKVNGKANIDNNNFIQRYSTSGTQKGYHITVNENDTALIQVISSTGAVGVIVKTGGVNATLVTLSGSFAAFSSTHTDIFLRTGTDNRSLIIASTYFYNDFNIEPYS